MTRAAAEPVPSARRAELLELAYQYAVARGSAELSLRPLAAAVGSSPRVLLYLFGSKDGLVRALLTRARADELALLRDAADAQSSGRPGPPVQPRREPGPPRREPARPAGGPARPPGAGPPGRPPGRDRRAHVVLAGRRRPPRPADACWVDGVLRAAWPIRTARGPVLPPAPWPTGSRSWPPPSPRRAGTRAAGRAERRWSWPSCAARCSTCLPRATSRARRRPCAFSSPRWVRLLERERGQSRMRRYSPPAKPGRPGPGPSRLVLGLDASPERLRPTPPARPRHRGSAGAARRPRPCGRW